MFVSIDIYPHDIVLSFKSKGGSNKFCVDNIDSNETDQIKVKVLELLYEVIKLNEFRKESKHDLEGQS